MKVLILVPILLVLNLTIYAQEQQNISTLFQQENIKESRANDLLFIVREPTSQEFEEVKWQSAVLIDYKHDAYAVKSHYDSKADEMQILLKDKPKVIFPQKIKAIKIGKMIFVPHTFKNQKDTAIGYFRILSENKIKLLQRYESSNAKIKKTYFICRKGEVASPLKLSRKCILKNIGNSNTTDFLKNSDLNIKNEEDLVKLFDFYNGNLE